MREASLRSGKVHYFDLVDVLAEIVTTHGLSGSCSCLQRLISWKAVRSTHDPLPPDVPQTQAWHSDMWRDTVLMFRNLVTRTKGMHTPYVAAFSDCPRGAFAVLGSADRCIRSFPNAFFVHHLHRGQATY
jgi:hypothetical protein